MSIDAYRAAWADYQSAWSAIDAAERQRLIGKSVAEDCVYTDPAGVCRGHGELIAYLEQFQKRLPGAYFENQLFTAHHGQALAHWTRYDPQGNPTIGGASYARFGDDGRLTQMTGFPDAAPGAG